MLLVLKLIGLSQFEITITIVTITEIVPIIAVVSYNRKVPTNIKMKMSCFRNL